MTTTVKEEMKDLADRLSDDATWEDVAYAVYVRESIDRGIADLEAGRIVSHEEVKRRLGLAQ